MIDLMTTERQMLTPDEVAAIFVVSRRTVYNWINAGCLEFVTFHGTIRISVAYLRGQVNRATTDLPLPTISKYQQSRPSALSSHA